MSSWYIVDIVNIVNIWRVPTILNITFCDVARRIENKNCIFLDELQKHCFELKFSKKQYWNKSSNIEENACHALSWVLFPLFKDKVVVINLLQKVSTSLVGKNYKAWNHSFILFSSLGITGTNESIYLFFFTRLSLPNDGLT